MYEFVYDENYEDVIETIAECGGFASTSILAEREILYLAWRLQEVHIISLTNHPVKGWGFTIGRTNDDNAI